MPRRMGRSDGYSWKDVEGMAEPDLAVEFTSTGHNIPDYYAPLPEDSEPGESIDEREITKISIGGVELPESLREALEPYVLGEVYEVDLSEEQRGCHA